MLIFNSRMHSIYIQYTSHKQIIKTVGSFSEHCSWLKDKYVPSPKKYKRQIIPLLTYNGHLSTTATSSAFKAAVVKRFDCNYKNTFLWWDLVYLKLYSQVFNLCLFNFLPRVCWFSKQVICTPCVPIFTTWALAWSKSKASLRLRLFCMMKCIHQYKQKIWKYFGFVAKINFFLLSLI